MGLGDVIVSVDCNDYPTVMFNETFTDTVCTETGYLRLMRCTWHATDGFGNSSMFRFFIKIVDNVPPVFNTTPQNLYVSNLSSVPQPALVMATDNCDLVVDYVFNEEILNTEGCVAHVKRQWVATDHCGNAAATTQNIYVMPSLAGLNWNGSANGDTLFFNCGDNFTTPTADDLNWALTCLDNPTVNLQTETLSGLGCVNKLISLTKYTWTATDAQNNIFQFVLYMAVKDVVAPQFSSIDQDIVITTLDDYPAVPSIIATDACDGNVEVTFVESPDTLTCGSTLYRVWTAVDDCGNVSVLSQSITLSCDCALEFFEHDAFLLVQFDCTEPGYYCAPVYPENLDKYTFLDNGQPYQGNQYYCADKLLVEYDLDFLPGGGETGPYAITNWQVNGNNLSGTFSNIPTMLAFLNEVDPLGAWELWPGTLTMCGDAENGQVYGPMTIVHLPSGTVTTLEPFEEFMPLGVEFEFSTGTHYFEVIENATGCRDTLYLKVLCLQLPVIQVQTYVTLGGYDSYCLDQLGLGVITSVEEVCPNLNGSDVLYEFDPEYNCYYYDGLEIGTDTLCLHICLDNGLCALVYLQTTVVPATNPGNQNLVVYAGQTGSVKLLADELTASPNLIKCIQDPDAQILLINPDHSQGIFYNAQSTGQTLAKFVMRDSTGVTDTVNLHITVLANMVAAVLPVAMPDYATTTTNETIEIPVGANDSLFNSTIEQHLIVEFPNYGQISWPTPTQPLTYRPHSGFCNDTITDRLIYLICNSHGCDTALVQIRVLCKELTFFNAVSPNGDGRNDVFFIEGLQRYPDHHLTIFNRWGMRVYQAAPYTNNWSATWQGSPLPDGTYFYSLDDGAGTTYSGYIQVQR
jgi:gliding motility-associated-like protein